MATRTALSRLDSGWKMVTDNGENYLDARVFPTKPGIFRYLNKDGSIRRELRPRAEVHDALSLQTLVNKPFTNSHPPTLLNAQNTGKYSTGHVYGDHAISEDGLHTTARVLVTDAQQIKDINQGKVQVSCGYTCDLDETPGVDPEFGEYDAIQKNIRYNHLASEWRGRAGPGARVTADSADSDRMRFDAEELPEEPEPPSPPQTPPPTRKDSRMDLVKVRIDGHDVEVTKEAAIALSSAVQKSDRAFETEKTRADQAENKVKELETQLSEQKAHYDSASNELKQLQDQQKNQARKDLEAEAKQLYPEVKTDGQSERQIKEQVIKARLDWAEDELNENPDDAYVNSLYKVAAKQPKRKSMMDGYGSAEPFGDKEKPGKTRSDKELSGYERMIQNKENAWKAGK